MGARDFKKGCIQPKLQCVGAFGWLGLCTGGALGLVGWFGLRTKKSARIMQGF